MEKEILLSKKYRFPNDIRVIEHNNKYIVIAPQYSNWIVLENKSELDFFNLLSSYSIEEALTLQDVSFQVMSNVIMQIEARHLESMVVSRNGYTHMQIYLTNNCNMRCPHCFMHAGDKLKDELSTTEILNLLKDFRESGGTKIILSGGEIGLRKDLEEIINWGSELGLGIELLSNGTLFTEDFIRRVADKISRVQISIDGYSEESNSKIRGKSNFKKALSCADAFIKQNIRVEIAITPFPSIDLALEAKEYIKFGKHLIEKYGNKILVKFTTDIFEGREVDLTKIDKAQYRDIMTHIIENVYGVSDDKSGFILSARKQVVNDNCAYGALNISANGNVYPCAKINSISHFANIRTSAWKDIVAESRLLKGKSNITKLAPCKDCELIFICGGGCRIDYFDNFNKPKDLLDSDTIPQRVKCQEREKILDLLIETNEYIFR